MVTFLTALCVMTGSALGAVLRFLTDAAFQAWWERRLLAGKKAPNFSIGIVLVNLVGSFLLGIIIGGTMTGTFTWWGNALWGVGLCGALTTFSTFSTETVGLLRRKRYWTALFYVLGSVLAGLLLALAGVAIVLPL